MSDADAPLVGDICNKLDGIALAIELAAARIDAFGVRGVAAHLDDRFRLLTKGRRTALPRHRTLGATLDWSYGLLTELQQMVFRRLAVFARGFTFHAAGAVAADATHPKSEIIDQVAELIAKSLVTADVGEAEPRLRLLDTTRAYALEKLGESGEAEMLARRHAAYYRDLLEAAERDKPSGDDWAAAYMPDIDNIRAALDWAFCPGGGVGGRQIRERQPVRYLDWAGYGSDYRADRRRSTGNLAQIADHFRGDRRISAVFIARQRFRVGQAHRLYRVGRRAVDRLAEIHGSELPR